MSLSSPTASAGHPAHVPRSAWADRLGMGVSALCAVHCALLPVTLVALPSVGAWMGNETLEWSLLALAGAVVVLAAGAGYLHHGSLRPWTFLTPGLLLLVLARGLETFYDLTLISAALSVIGAVLLIAAHWINLHLCRRCRHAAVPPRPGSELGPGP